MSRGQLDCDPLAELTQRQIGDRVDVAIAFLPVDDAQVTKSIRNANPFLYNCVSVS